MIEEYEVVIPNHEWRYKLSDRTTVKYWKVRELDKLPKKHLAVRGKDIGPYLADKEGNKFIKNPGKAGKPNYWTVNGQAIYSGNMRPLMRSKITAYYHKYLAQYIEEQMEPIYVDSNSYVEISCHVAEKRRPQMPDPSNLWLWTKWFEDTLQETTILVNDNNKVVKDTGRVTYREVYDEQDEELVFKVKVYDLKLISSMQLKQLDSILKLGESIDEKGNVITRSGNLNKALDSIKLGKGLYVGLINQAFSHQLDKTIQIIEAVKWDQDLSYKQKIKVMADELKEVKEGLTKEHMGILKSASKESYRLMVNKLEEAMLYLEFEMEELISKDNGKQENK